MAASTKAQLGARVSPEVRDAVKAKAAAEGVSLNAWVERALGAALETPDGGPSPDQGGGSRSKPERAAPAPRRASTESAIGRCTNARCAETGRVGDHCPRDPHLTFKA